MNQKNPTINPVFYGEESYQELNNFLTRTNPSGIFVLVDSNTQVNCLSIFLQKLKTEIQIEVIEIEPGEENKNIETCSGVWNALSELDADRKSLVINLGGGVVTDLGGFVAATFKRGIKFINVPTTLLSMVDASVGGKNGVDLGNLKNQVGVITPPEMVLIDSVYLNTLSPQEMRSGLAEILKHGLIADELYWKKVSDLKSLDLSDLDSIIKESVNIKSNIVKQDPLENSIRKKLNYGHTLGHAIESYCLTNSNKGKLLHGEAIAIGMILETYLSTQLKEFPMEKLKEISSILIGIYGKVNFDLQEIEQIIELMKFDKKNERGNVNFVLLQDVGEALIDVTVPNEVVKNAFEYYLSL